MKSSKEATARARACDASVLVNLDANPLVQLPRLASLIPVSPLFAARGPIIIKTRKVLSVVMVQKNN